MTGVQTCALPIYPEGKVAVETMIKNNQVIVAGELSTKAQIDVEQVIRKRVDNQARADRLVQFWRGEGRAYARWAFRRGEMLRALDA